MKVFLQPARGVIASPKNVVEHLPFFINFNVATKLNDEELLTFVQILRAVAPYELACLQVRSISIL